MSDVSPRLPLEPIAPQTTANEGTKLDSIAANQSGTENDDKRIAWYTRKMAFYTRRLSSYTLFLGIATLLLAMGTIVLAIYTINLAVDSNKQVAITSETLKEQRNRTAIANLAILKQDTVNEWQLRAYITIKIDTQFAPVYFSMVDTEFVRLRFRLLYSNSGRTPAYHVRFFCNDTIESLTGQQNFYTPDVTLSDVTLSSGDQESQWEDFFFKVDDLRKSVWLAESECYVWGWVKYVDIFGHERTTPFRYETGMFYPHIFPKLYPSSKGNTPN